MQRWEVLFECTWVLQVVVPVAAFWCRLGWLRLLQLEALWQVPNRSGRPWAFPQRSKSLVFSPFL